jgi:outer membrane protein assembly factor BamD
VKLLPRIVLALVLVAFASPPAFAERARMSAEDAYELGQRYLKRGYYVKALDQLNRVRTYYRDDPYALKAELAIADLHFKKAEWDAARLAYEDFMRAHPRYRELDFVLYRYGVTLFRKAPSVAAKDQTWTRQAVNAWTGFGARFPDSTHREAVETDLGKARDRLARKELLVARFYDRRKAHVAVAGRVEGILADYPASPDRREALALGGIAWAGLGEVDRAREALTTLEGEGASPILLRRLHAAIHDAEVAAAEAAAPVGPSATDPPATP